MCSGYAAAVTSHLVGEASHLIHETARAVSVDRVVWCAGAETPVGNCTGGAVPARGWREAVRRVGHTVAVEGAVLGTPGVGQGLKIQCLTGLDVCKAQQRDGM